MSWKNKARSILSSGAAATPAIPATVPQEPAKHLEKTVAGPLLPAATLLKNEVEQKKVAGSSRAIATKKAPCFLASRPAIAEIAGIAGRRDAWIEKHKDRLLRAGYDLARLKAHSGWSWAEQVELMLWGNCPYEAVTFYSETEGLKVYYHDL